MALVQGIGQAENRRQLSRNDLLPWRQGMVDWRRFLQGTVKGIVEDGGQDFLFIVGQAEEVRFPDEVIRAEVVFADIDEFLASDTVQARRLRRKNEKKMEKSNVE